MRNHQHVISAEEERRIRALYPSLRRFAKAVAPAEVEPEDLVQEAFYLMLRRSDSTPIRNPDAYLRRTMVNLASNHRRRLGRQRKAMPLLASDDSAGDAYPSDVAELLSLKPQARAVIYLRIIEGRRYREIGELLGCRESAARTIANRARKRLRTLMTEEVPDATA